MPYGKPYMYKRRHYGRKRKYRKKKSLPLKNYISLRKLKKAVGKVEYKYFDTAIDTFIDNNGQMFTLNNLTQGISDIGHRIGDSVTMQNLTVRGHIANNASLSVGRIIVFLDKLDVVAVPIDILSSTYVGTTSATEAFKSYDRRFDTKILWDRRFVNVNNTHRETFSFKKVIPIHKMSQFVGGTSQLNKNSLKVLFISDQPAMGVSRPQVIIAFRLTYTDS